MMPRAELAQLELLAEVDALVDRLRRWADSAPDWQPAEKCQALVRRLVARADSLRVRIEAPLVVATLGGSGVGKSALINALVGTEVVQTGRSRPTTTRPTLVCRPGLTPEVLGIDPTTVERVEQDLPSLRDLVLVDCPDPDTTEGEENAAAPLSSLSPSLSPLENNLARLRAILPHCDVLLVVGTQQKYRSGRVAKELAAAAHGAQLVFVQTRSDLDADIRDDWQKVIETENLTSPAGRGAGDEGGENVTEPDTQALTLALSQRERGPMHIFRIDSLRALADAQAGMQPRGDFADLLDLLTVQMAGAAANRIRRVNFLDLVAETLDACLARVDQSMPAVRELQDAIDQQRAVLASNIAGQMQTELLAGRRQWENRLLARVVSGWGFSPFSLVLRTYQGIGSLLTGALIYRSRTPAQMALWGTVEGVRTWRRRRQDKQADRAAAWAAAGGWDTTELRKAAMIIEGYAVEAGLWDGNARASTGEDRHIALADGLAIEAQQAAAGFAARASADLESLVARLARRHTGWFTRWRYEILFVGMMGLLLYRLGKNFFCDSWWAENPVPVFGIDFYLSAGFWLLLWCLLLLWSFCSRLRRGLRGEIKQLTSGWRDASLAEGLFAGIEDNGHRADRFRQQLVALRDDANSFYLSLARRSH